MTFIDFLISIMSFVSTIISSCFSLLMGKFAPSAVALSIVFGVSVLSYVLKFLKGMIR